MAIQNFKIRVYFSYIFFGILGLLIIRSLKIKEVLQYLVGFGVVYFLIFAYKFFYDIPFVEFSFVTDIFFRVPILDLGQPVVTYLTILVSFGLALVSLFAYGVVSAKKTISSQRKIDILYWVLIFCGISYFIFFTNQYLHILSLAIPVSIILGIWLGESKAKIGPELIHIIIIVLIFLAHLRLITF